MKKSFHTTTNASFTTSDGRIVRLEPVFEGIGKTVDHYAHMGKNGLSSETLKDLQDAAQDAAVKVLENVDRFDLDKCHGRPQAFGQCVAKSKVLDAFDKADRHRKTFTPLVRTNQDGEEEESQVILDLVGDEFGPERQIESQENMSYIMDKMNSLNDRYRRVIQLKADGYKTREIAKILGCTTQEASMTLCRARQAMKKALGREFLSEFRIGA